MEAAAPVVDKLAEPSALAADHQRTGRGQPDNRAVPVLQRRLQGAIYASPRQRGALQLQSAINGSLRQQRQAALRPAPAANRTGLPNRLKAGIESLSGHSLDDVRVHYNSAQPAQLQAHAYAQGTSIHIAPGQEQHLPHEAWHVVQQKQGRVKPTIQLKGRVAVNDNSGLEREADRMGALALRVPAQRRAAGPLATGGAAAPVVQRQVLTKFEFAPPEPQVAQAPAAPPRVADVILGGRTPSPFGGTMGAHSTAWVAHLDAVRRQLVNRSLTAGATALIVLAQHELTSDLADLQDLLQDRHRTLLAAAKKDLEAAISRVNNALTPPDQLGLVPSLGSLGGTGLGSSALALSSPAPTTDVWQPLAQAVRELIDAYLTYVNYLPGATVAGGDPRGHGEGSARGDLNMFEAVYARHERIQLLNQEDEALAAELNELGVDPDGTQQQQRQKAIGKERKTLRTEQDSVATSAKKKKGKKNEQEQQEAEATSMPHVLKKSAAQDFVAPVTAPRAYHQTAEADKRKRENIQTLRQQVSDRLWNLFAGETPTVLAQGASGSVDETRQVDIWGRMVRNFLHTIRTAYPYAYRFANMHTVAAQQAGLRASIRDAGFAPPTDTVREAVLANLASDPVAEPATVRPDHSGVAASDLQQVGSGFQANVLLDDATRIADVVMTGRTPSPFSGTMGAHTTAWTVHVDGIRRSLTGQLLQEAFGILHAKARKEMSLKNEVLQLSNELDEKHQVALLNAFTALSSRNDAVSGYASLDTLQQTAHLENYIREYLTLINFLPMSTISVSYIPNGRSEGQHRTFLNNYETQGAGMLKGGVSQDLLRQHLLGLFDSKALSDFPPDLVERDDSYVPRSMETPYEEHPLYDLMTAPEGTRQPEEYQYLAWQRLYEALFEAYPRSLLASGLLDMKDEEKRGEKKKAQEEKRDWEDESDKEEEEEWEDWQKPAPGVLAHEKKKIREDEDAKLRELVGRNNCLINAIARAADKSPITYEQVFDIRLRIGSLGRMLQADERVISIIRDVLGIEEGIVVQYASGGDDEAFGNTDHAPIFIHHTGAFHFEPGMLLEHQDAEEPRAATMTDSASDEQKTPERPATDTKARKRARSSSAKEGNEEEKTPELPNDDPDAMNVDLSDEGEPIEQEEKSDDPESPRPAYKKNRPNSKPPEGRDK